MKLPSEGTRVRKTVKSVLLNEWEIRISKNEEILINDWSFSKTDPVNYTTLNLLVQNNLGENYNNSNREIIV